MSNPFADGYVIQVRSAYLVDLLAKDRVYEVGEFIYVKDTKRFRIGDGVRKFSLLDEYIPSTQLLPLLEGMVLAAGVSAPITMDEHIHSQLPHPVYDEGPDLTVYYENAKV